ncbi:transcriptional regulator, IclR family [Rhizobium sp. CF080]|nr:transcriptional regulator, IclR family [Rhizobium sp. CF080]
MSRVPFDYPSHADDPGEEALLENAEPATREDASGAQSIHRAMQVMRILAAEGEDGLRLTEIALRLQLSYPTAHRILKALELEGVVERAHGSRRYTIGTEMMWFGLRASTRFPIKAASAQTLDRLSDEIGDTILLTVRSGHDSVCVDRRAKSSAVHVTAAAIGSRLPLGVTPGGRAMLAFLPERMSQSIIAANAPHLDAYNSSEISVGEYLKATKAKGYGICEGLTVRETLALTVPVFDAGGVPVAALSAITARRRMPDHRLGEVVRVLSRSAKEISNALLRSNIEKSKLAGLAVG